MDRLYVNEILYGGGLPENSYLTKLPVLQALKRESLRLDRPVTIFVGENGTGKSTLLEAVALAYGFNAEGGTRNFRFSTKATHSDLYRHILLGKAARARDGFFLRAESLYNVATDIDRMDAEPSFGPPLIDSYGGVSLHEQSHGESFLSIVHNRFHGNGLYILDEPEAALSPMRILTLIAEINALVKKDSQFVIATHSPILMAIPDARVYELSDGGIRAVDYRETEHFQVTRRFLNDPDRMLRLLLEGS